jgi:hypothetical protein
MTTNADAFTAGKAIEVDATYAPGLYRIDWPDAAFAAGVDKVLLSVTATGCNAVHEQIDLGDANLDAQTYELGTMLETIIGTTSNSYDYLQDILTTSDGHYIFQSRAMVNSNALGADWPGDYAEGSFGAWIATMLDAPITSRAGSDSADIAVTSTVSETGAISIQAGDDYPAANPIVLTRTWTDVNVSGYSAALWVRAGTRGAAGATTGTVTHTLADGVLSASIVLTHDQTAALVPAGESAGPFTYSYQVVLTSGDGGVIKSPFKDTLTVVRALTN